MSERAVQFGRTGTLAGVLTEASADVPALPLLVIARSASMQCAAGRRLSVELARAAREHGLHSLRFDLAGCGVSGARMTGESAADAASNDIFDAVDHVSRARPDRACILLGIGPDIDAIYRVAVHDPRIAGVISINGPAFRTWSHWLRRCAQALSLSWWWRRDSREQLAGDVGGEQDAAGVLAGDRQAFAAAIQALADRGARTLHIYSGGATARRFNHARQFWAMLPALRTDGRLAVGYLPAADSGFTCRDDREQLFSICLEWVLR